MTVKSMLRLSAAIICAASGATAATRPDAEAPSYRGAPVAQLFLGGDASLVRDAEGGAACVASKAIPVDAAQYIEPDGARTSFAQVTRSRGASVQYIVSPQDLTARWRVQLKYPVSRAAAMTMTIDGAAMDVSAMLESSGDSLLIDDLALSQRLRAAFEQGRPVAVDAYSEDTGRHVTDRLVGPRFETVDSCARSAGFITDGPEPVNDISIALDAPMVPANLAPPEVVTACAMTETTDPVYFGLLRSTTGFFAQTQKALVAYDDQGEVSRVYVPGVFDARLDEVGDYPARISISADSNLPMAANSVKGCLGDDIETLSWLSGEDTPDIVLGPRFGDLLAGDFLEGLTPREFLSGVRPAAPIPLAPRALRRPDDFRTETVSLDNPPTTPASGGSFPAPAVGPGGGGSPSGGSTGGGSTGGDSTGGDSGPAAAVPLPPALALMGGAVVALTLLRRRRKS